MAATTEAFACTTAAYRDVSEGAAYCGFQIKFDPQTKNAVRVIIASSLPAADSSDYVGVDPNDNRVGPDNLSQSMFFEVFGLASTDRVYVRGEANTVQVVAVRI